MAIAAAPQPNAAYLPFAKVTASGPFADANAINLVDDITFVAQADGTYLAHQHRLIKLMTPVGIRQFSEVGQLHGQGVVLIHFAAHTINSDGISEPAADAVKELTPPVLADAPMYSDLRLHSVTMPALHVGSVVEMTLDWRLAHLEMPGAFWFGVGQAPSQRISIHVELPADRPLHWDTAPPIAAPDGDRSEFTFQHSQRRVAPDRVEYDFELRNVPTFPREAAAPPAPVLLRMSTIPDWRSIGVWYRQLTEPLLQPTPTITAKAQELTAGASDDGARALKLFAFVSSQFRYVSLDFGIGAYRPHAPEQVLRTGYGDCKDKAALLIALLRAVKIPADFVLLGTDRPLSTKVASLEQLNHAFVVAQIGGRGVYLDATTGGLAFGQLLSLEADRDAVSTSATAPGRIHLPPVPDSLLAEEETNDESLTADGTIKSKTVVASEGDQAALVRTLMKLFSGDQLKDFEKGLAFAASSSTTLDQFTAQGADDFSRSMGWRTERTMSQATDLTQAAPTLPLWWHLGVQDLDASRHGRANPLELSVLIPDFHQKIRIHLPSGFRPQLPDNAAKATDFANFTLQYSYDEKSNEFTADATLRRLKPELAKDRFADFVAFDQLVTRDLKDRIPLQLATGLGEAAVAGRLGEIRKALREGQGEQAVAEAAALYKAAPDGPAIRDLLAEADLATGKFDQARQVLAEQARRYPSDLRLHGLNARLAALNHQPDQALAELALQEKLTPYDADMYGLRGQLLSGEKQWGAAADAYAQAVRIAPDDPRWQAGEGLALLRQGQPTTARPLLASAVAADQTPAETSAQVGEALVEAGGDAALARQALVRALQSWQPSLPTQAAEPLTTASRAAVAAMPDALAALARLEQAQHPALAATDLEIACAMRPAEKQLWRQAADLALAAHQPARATALLVNAMKMAGGGADLLQAVLKAYAQIQPAPGLPVNLYLAQHPELTGFAGFAFAPGSGFAYRLLIQDGKWNGSSAQMPAGLAEKLRHTSFPLLQLDGHSYAYPVNVRTNGEQPTIVETPAS